MRQIKKQQHKMLFLLFYYNTTRKKDPWAEYLPYHIYHKYKKNVPSGEQYIFFSNPI